MMRLTLRATLLVLLTSTPCAALPGDLETSFAGFGSDGRIQNLGFSVGAGVYGVRSLALDAQGRLVLAGGSDGSMRVQRRSA